MSTVDEIIADWKDAMAKAEHETADFICETCGTEQHNLPMTAYLEYGEPSCPKGCGYAHMLRVHQHQPT